MTTEVHVPLQAVIADLAHGRPLTDEAVSAAFDVVMRGDASPVQIAALLTGLRVRGEPSEVIAGVARAMRRAMIRLETNAPDMLVDTCGTGGGTVTTFNISTAAALVAAGAGVRIAKHGNRSFTSKSGSADVLEALGVGIDVDVSAMRAALETAGLVFMYAPRMHPAMRHVGPIRRELAVPTVMNVVGPLANPASAGRQVIGVADRVKLQTIADALVALGTVHSLVVHGEPGMDEISPLGNTTVIEIQGGVTREWILDPRSYGFAIAGASELAGDTPEVNAALIERMFEPGVAADVPDGAKAAVLLNAAAAIYISGMAGNFAQGVERARAAIDEGRAREALRRLRAALPA
jgi:anthranilate phosphoribosyltransferase